MSGLWKTKQEWFAEKKAELKKKRAEEIAFNEEMNRAVEELKVEVIRSRGAACLEIDEISDEELERMLSEGND